MFFFAVFRHLRREALCRSSSSRHLPRLWRIHAPEGREDLPRVQGLFPPPVALAGALSRHDTLLWCRPRRSTCCWNHFGIYGSSGRRAGSFRLATSPQHSPVCVRSSTRALTPLLPSLRASDRKELSMAHYLINTRCIGCIACTRVASELFEVYQKRARLLRQPTTAEDLALFAEAMDCCPASAIEATEEAISL